MPKKVVVQEIQEPEPEPVPKARGRPKKPPDAPKAKYTPRPRKAPPPDPPAPPPMQAPPPPDIHAMARYVTREVGAMQRQSLEERRDKWRDMVASRYQ